MILKLQGRGTLNKETPNNPKYILHCSKHYMLCVGLSMHDYIYASKEGGTKTSTVKGSMNLSRANMQNNNDDEEELGQ